MTSAEARFNKSLRPRKPEGSLGRTAQDVHLDSHTAPDLCVMKGPVTNPFVHLYTVKLRIYSPLRLVTLFFLSFPSPTPPLPHLYLSPLLSLSVSLSLSLSLLGGTFTNVTEAATFPLSRRHQPFPCLADTDCFPVSPTPTVSLSRRHRLFPCLADTDCFPVSPTPTVSLSQQHELFLHCLGDTDCYCFLVSATQTVSCLSGDTDCFRFPVSATQTASVSQSRRHRGNIHKR